MLPFLQLYLLQILSRKLSKWSAKGLAVYLASLKSLGDSPHTIQDSLSFLANKTHMIWFGPYLLIFTSPPLLSLVLWAQKCQLLVILQTYTDCFLLCYAGHTALSVWRNLHMPITIYVTFSFHKTHLKSHLLLTFPTTLRLGWMILP